MKSIVTLAIYHLLGSLTFAVQAAEQGDVDRAKERVISQRIELQRAEAEKRRVLLLQDQINQYVSFNQKINRSINTRTSKINSLLVSYDQAIAQDIETLEGIKVWLQSSLSQAASANNPQQLRSFKESIADELALNKSLCSNLKYKKIIHKIDVEKHKIEYDVSDYEARTNKLLNNPQLPAGVKSDLKSQMGSIKPIKEKMKDLDAHLMVNMGSVPICETLKSVHKIMNIIESHLILIAATNTDEMKEQSGLITDILNTVQQQLQVIEKETHIRIYLTGIETSVSNLIRKGQITQLNQFQNNLLKLESILSNEINQPYFPATKVEELQEKSNQLFDSIRSDIAELKDNTKKLNLLTYRRLRFLVVKAKKAYKKGHISESLVEEASKVGIDIPKGRKRYTQKSDYNEILDFHDLLDKIDKAIKGEK